MLGRKYLLRGEVLSWIAISEVEATEAVRLSDVFALHGQRLPADPVNFRDETRKLGCAKTWHRDWHEAAARPDWLQITKTKSLSFPETNPASFFMND